tara:strand:- start:258 stop:1271 length:1014 start_codon:yes stop_codon:yes gene_type:complete
MIKILVTGTAGFIGSELALKLLKNSKYVVGIDNHNNYYDIKLKNARVSRLKKFSNYLHHRVDITNKTALERIFVKHKPSIVINLAAQAGVRYSITNPYAYVDSNLLGFLNVLEKCRHHNIKHLIYASSSSVYGQNKKKPFSETDDIRSPSNIYGATKQSNELMAYAYSHLYNLPTTGLRFFSVYGPWGRPDMALFKFTKNIIENKPIDIYNYGDHSRDFTYIDDVVNAIYKIINKNLKFQKKLEKKKKISKSQDMLSNVYNIGSSKPEKLLNFVSEIEKVIKRKAKINFLPLQAGDIKETSANINLMKKNFKWKPKVSTKVGIRRFVKWYLKFYKYL